MLNHRVSTGRRSAAVLALTLAATLFVSALGPQAPAGAAAAPAEPAARLQVVVKQVRVNDDHDWLGQGDMTLTVSLLRCPLPLPRCAPADLELLARSATTFGASSGEAVPLDRVFPQNDELVRDDSYAGYAGERYVLLFSMVDRDGPGGSDDDQLGRVATEFGGGNGWRIGTHKERSLAPTQGSDGDYELEFEIRPAPLPDLQALHQIDVHELPGGAKQRVCMVVHNPGVAPAGPFEVALRVDGGVPPDGTTTAPGLAPGTNYDACVETALPASGQHRLAAVVDAPHALTEFNEANNVYERPYTPAPPTPGPARPDLTVSAIRVNGQVPDGQDDCRDARNDLAVVVKNAGAADAGGFAVRLVVDGDDEQAKEKSVAGLEPGQEREVRFDDVRLKGGGHNLTALADSKYAVAESGEDNNDRYVDARCTDDD